MHIEPLEALLAPASLTFTDVDGAGVSSHLIAGIAANGVFGDSDEAKISGAGVKDNADLGGSGVISKITARNDLHAARLPLGVTKGTGGDFNAFEIPLT